jgi:hypothetical protein
MKNWPVEADVDVRAAANPVTDMRTRIPGSGAG